MTQHDDGTQAPEQAPAAETASAPVRRRRAASRPAGPPVHVDQADADGAATSSDATSGDALVAEAAPDTSAPTAAPTRRRAARKTAAAALAAVEGREVAALAPSAQDPAAEDPVAQEPATPEPSAEPPVAKTPRRRTRKAAAPVVEEPPVEVPAAQESTPEEEVASDDVVAPEEEPAPLAPPALSLFAMPLFQAPDPSAAAPRRRRAASRPAGPPVPVEETPEQDALAPAARTADQEAEEALAESDDDEDDDLEGAEEGPESAARRRRRRRGGRGRRSRTREDAEGEEGVEPEAAASTETEPAADDEADDDEEAGESTVGSRRRRRRRRRSGSTADAEPGADDPPNTVVRVREARRTTSDDVSGLRGSTRLEAKKQRRREGREAGRRRPIITEAEFLARRESVDRVMVVREREGRTQIGVLEDGVLVEHYVARRTQSSAVGNVFLGRVQNVLPSMEAAFVDIGKGRNAVLYAGEVNWDAAGLEGQPKRIEHALKSGESVLVQVTKDPIGHKGARLTSQISLPGRYLVYVPDGSMTGISRKLPDTERARLKRILRDVVPDDAGVIVRTAAEGASEDELKRDVARLQAQWEDISRKASAVNAPALLYGEPDLAIRVVRDIFNEDFAKLVISGDDAWDTLHAYIGHVAPDLVDRLERWSGDGDVFAVHRIDEQLAKGLDRKVWLPSGGSLVIDRTEAMTVIDVNTGKFTGAGGNLEETVTKNNLEAAEEIVRQLRLRDLGGIIVVDFIDMVLESNRELVLRRLLECLGRDRTKHQVAEVTSLGLVQMTRKRVGQGLLEVFSETCEHCAGRGVIVHDEPVEKRGDQGQQGHQVGSGNGGAGSSGSGGSTGSGGSSRSGRRRGRGSSQPQDAPSEAEAPAAVAGS